MARLPIPGSDDGTWGDILNTYLSVEHNANGTQKPLPQSTIIDLEDDLASVQTDLAAKYTLPGSGIPKDDLSAAVQASLDAADEEDAVTSVDGQTGDVDLSGTYVQTPSGAPVTAGTIVTEDADAYVALVLGTTEAEIQAALDAVPANGGTVVLRGDVEYSDLTTALKVKSKTQFFGRGARLRLADGSDSDMITNADWAAGNSEILIEGFWLDGNRTGQSNILGDGPGQSLVSLIHVTDSVVRDVAGTSPQLHGIDIGVRDEIANSFGDVTTRITVDNCRFEDFGDDGITMHWATRVAISDCHMRNAAASYSGSSNGIEIDDGSADVTVTGCTASNCVRGFMVQGHAGRQAAVRVTMTGCVATGCTDAGFLCAVSTTAGPTPARLVSITGCSTSGNPVGYFVSGYQDVTFTGCTSNDTVPLRITAGPTGTTKNISFVGCRFYGATNVNLNSADTSAVSFTDCSFVGFTTASGSVNVAIPDVVFSACRITGGAGKGLLITTGANRARVQGCSIHGNGDSGLQVNNATDVVVAHNHIFDNTSRGLHLSGTPANLMIIGNRIRWSGAGAAFTQSYAIRVENGAAVALIADNDLSGNGTAAVQSISGGTAITWRDNIGYVTRAVGATSVADGGTVSHGLVAAPTTVRVTGSVAGEIATVTTLSASTFTVALKTGAGAAGTTQVVYWEAAVS
jgi:hypothetical protein